MEKNNICARENRPCHLADKNGACAMGAPPPKKNPMPESEIPEGVGPRWETERIIYDDDGDVEYPPMVEKTEAVKKTEELNRAYEIACNILLQLRTAYADDEIHISLLKEKLATLTKESLDSEAEHMRKLYVMTVGRVAQKDQRITELEKMLKDGTAYKAWKEIDNDYHKLEEDAGERIAELELQLKNVNAACTDYRQKWKLAESAVKQLEAKLAEAYQGADFISAERVKDLRAELEAAEKALSAAMNQYAGEAAEYYERKIAEAEANYSGMRASWQAALNRALLAETRVAEEGAAREKSASEMRRDWGRREDIWEGRLAMAKAQSKTFFEEGIKRADKIAKLEAIIREITSPPKPEEREGEFPSADESTWPPNAKKSTRTSQFYNGVLGKIVSDGERGYICTHCGKVVTKAHHIKPESYAVIYEGQRFYMERHICDDCMKAHVVKSPAAVSGGEHGARGNPATPAEEFSGVLKHSPPAETAGDPKSPEEKNIDAHAEELETMEFLIRQYANGDESKMLAGAIAFKDHIIGILNRLGWSRVPIPKGHLFEIRCPNCGGFWHDPANNVGREELCRKCKLSPDVFAEFTMAMRAKFNKALTKDANRSKTPWTAYNLEWLKERLMDEWMEWRESEEPEELLDIANFCMFIWKRMTSGGKP